MRRAIVTFIENKYALKVQLAGLYMSLKYIQPLDTDLIVFGNPFTLSQIRLDCIKIPYHYEGNTTWKDYPFIYSISCLNGPQAAILDNYDYLLRSDVDTFLTYKWHSFHPTTYAFGRGGYVNTAITRENLMATADKLGLKHHGLHNIGSTHYGPTPLIKEVHKLATEVTDYLLHHAFLDGPGAWPCWFKGVASLYGTEIAVNHLVKDYCVLDQDLDYPSSSSECIYDHTHIHCWHTDKLFSKTTFLKSGYHEINLPSYAPETIDTYSLYMARHGKNALVYGKENFFA